MKGCIPLPKKGDLGLAKNYQGITLTSKAAKIHNALLRNRIEPKIDNILRKNQNDFRRKKSMTSQISLKAYGQKTYKRHYYLSTLRRPSIHSQRKDGTNPTSIRPTKRNRSSNNDSL